MIDFEKLEKELQSLDTSFLNILLFNLMKTGKLNYIEFSKIYVEYLKNKSEDNNQLIADLGYSLMHHRHPNLVGGNTKKEKQDFINEKAISALRRTRLFPDDAKL